MTQISRVDPVRAPRPGTLNTGLEKQLRSMMAMLVMLVMLVVSVTDSHLTPDRQRG